MMIRKVTVALAALSLMVVAPACDSGDGSTGGGGTGDASAGGGTDVGSGGGGGVGGSGGGDGTQADTGGAMGDDASMDESDADMGGSDAGPGAGDDAGGEPVDPCAGDPCTVAPATACKDETTIVSYTAPGTCTAEAGAAVCEFTSTDTACEGDKTCTNGVCSPPGAPEDYVFTDTVSWISTLAIAEDEPCCFDYSGDGEPDNGLGSLLGSLATFLSGSLPEGGINGLIQAQIDEGTIAILLEQIGLDSATDDDALSINGFFGTNDGELADAQAGMGSFAVDPASFVEGKAQPLISFQEAAIAAGTLSAGPALFVISIPLADFGFTLVLNVFNTQISADVATGPNGKGLDMTNGKLGGVVPMAQLVEALNALGTTCPCLGLAEGEAMLELGGEDKLKCTAAFNGASPACTEADGSLCTGLGDNKGLVCTAIGIIKPDIDTDLSGKADSFSVGITFAGTSATISGLEVPVEGGGGADGASME